LQRKLEERRQAAEQMQAATPVQPVVQQQTDPNIQFDGKSFTNGSKVKRSKAKQGKKGKKK
jgi:hypothetical protein